MKFNIQGHLIEASQIKNISDIIKQRVSLENVFIVTYLWEDGEEMTIEIGAFDSKWYTDTIKGDRVLADYERDVLEDRLKMFHARLKEEWRIQKYRIEDFILD